MNEIFEAFKQYLREEDCRDNTIEKYLTNIRLFAAWFAETNGSEFSPDSVTSLDLQDYRSYLDNVKKRSANTTNNVIATFKKFWEFAQEKGLTNTDPTRKLKTKRTTSQELSPKWHTRREQSKLLSYVEDEIENRKRANKKYSSQVRNLAMIHCMLSVGLRVEEVSDLQISDVDLVKGFLTVRAGKGNKFAVLPINKTVIECIKNWLGFRLEDGTNEDLPLFTSQKNDSISVRTIKHIVNQYAKKAQIDVLSCHTLRHSFCKNLIDEGFPLQYVAKLARHESIETTKRYTLPSITEMRKMVESINQ